MQSFSLIWESFGVKRWVLVAKNNNKVFQFGIVKKNTRVLCEVRGWKLFVKWIATFFEQKYGEGIEIQEDMS